MSDTSAYSDFISPVDLTTCEREPIHIPGTIQPHGIFAVLREPDLRIVQISQNTQELLGCDPHAVLGQPLETLLSAHDVAALRTQLATDRPVSIPVYCFSIGLGTPQTLFDAIIHRHGAIIILELEVVPSTPFSTTPNFFWLIQKAFVQVRDPELGLTDFCQRVAETVRDLIGFDRVMIYEFDADWNGAVIAEAAEADLEPFLGLHYPASDIPVQARALYTRNPLRLIADVHYRPVPVLPALNPDTHLPVDMSQSVLRSVSPIHLQYLTNMGVGASMSISLMHGDTLWGLIACHHRNARYVPYELRAACEFLSQAVSLHLATKQDSDVLARRVALKERLAQLIEQMAGAEHWSEALVGHEQSIASLLDCGGAALYTEDAPVVLLGATPDAAEITRLVEWLKATMTEDVFCTAHLVQQYPEAKAFSSSGSGLLALRLHQTRPVYILWFRPEVIQTVTWAGVPEKAVTIEAGSQRLMPRASFAAWRQQLADTALAWQPTDIAIIHDLRQAILTVIVAQAERVASLNVELARSNAELDAFAYIASHDLKEPLRGIHNYANFLIEDYADSLDAEGVAKLQTLSRLTQRMDDLIESLLQFSRVGRIELVCVPTDFNALLDQVREMLQARLDEAGVVLRVPRPLPTLAVDRVQVIEVLTNIISNALKYNDKAVKWVEIGYVEAHKPGDAVVFYVRDNGIGIESTHYDVIFRIFKRLHGRTAFGGGTGAGLTITKKIIERHGGAIWLESTLGEGTTFYFTLNA